MPNRLPNVITTPTQEEMFTALGSAYLQAMGGPPTKEKICLLMAQWAFETAWGKAMHCFNVGNVKSVNGDGRDFTYFRCWEMIPTSSVAGLQANTTYGSLVEVESSSGNSSKVWFNPDHPACRFCAFATLNLGAYDYFGRMLDKYTDDDPVKNAWGAVVRGDPAGFVHALKLKGYFTGDETIYTNQVTAIYKMLCQKPFDITQFQVHTPEEADETANWRIIATEQSTDDAPEDSGTA